MVRFRTEVNVATPDRLLSYASKLMLMGSCFTENIGIRFIEGRFNANLNPFGILYNPLSIARAIDHLVGNSVIDESNLWQHNGLWHHFDFHGRFSSLIREQAIKAMNEAISAGHQSLKQAEVLFITYGTAYVFEDVETQMVVGNCHKLPANRFYRYRLTPNEVIEAIAQMMDKILMFNPTLEVVFTVSPVRHLKDSAHGNQLSKSTLLLAVDEIVGRYRTASYFPAYELVLDDLRDYRFYDIDMVHPNTQASDYVWEKLVSGLLDEQAMEYLKETEQLNRARQHRPLFRESLEYRKFLESNLQKVDALMKKYPLAQLNADWDYFSTELEGLTQ